MPLDEYLESLRDGVFSDPGEFTMAADRAKVLLGGKALDDIWSAWLCLAQGFFMAGAPSLEVKVSRGQVEWCPGFESPRDVEELFRHDRFLLGWLNLGRFGRPHWNRDDSSLSLEWRGNAWQRHRASSQVKDLLGEGLKYAGVPVLVDRIAVGATRLPVGQPLCLYPLPVESPGGLFFEDAGLDVKGFYERRIFPLHFANPELQGPPSPRLAAIASKTKTSWSEVTWVHHGVVVSRERNTLERPGVSVVASVEALGLATDLSGFRLVVNEAYFQFVQQLKRDVLWML